MGRSFENRKASMAKTQGMKTKIYSKYGKEIYVCAKNGGLDPDGNLALRRLIDKAKKDQVPAHVIDKAIDKAAGGSGEDFESMRYEGFGPGNCMIIIDCLTDNTNRTIKDVRLCFTKTNSKIGAQGCASHMFDHVALFTCQGGDEETILENLMMEDCDITDVAADEDGVITVTGPQTEFFKIKTAFANTMPEITLEKEEITWLPQVYTELSGEDVEMFEKFLDMANDCDDVQEIYHNAQIAD
ncbi:YebC/PmpR family DNA-binding transcriptional regulator [Thalassotalea sp. LPB0316]|uniref:YebC/PmpR family DNA-binding transcriptional regulator n=1 Tax=Thalassotalea sp. LPB0316 TaxID=2769490 RepID=UPI0018668F84|nr:YebC/PmpR family DNA-binding transcriptional regulator [Thalassotalea sp. LPB0316]QOL26828.1 YebC/PmpR family DNA-binding transcriptional regulator [Thalassotalea sp. LPB0316]